MQPQPPSEEPSPIPQLPDGGGTSTWKPFRPTPEYPGFTAPLASFFREEEDGGDFPGPLPTLKGEEGGKGKFKKLQAETIRNAQLPPASSESPLPRIHSNPIPTAVSPSTVSFSPQSTKRPTASPVYYKPLPPQQSHFDKKLRGHVVRAQFGGPLPPQPQREDERLFEPRQEDIEIDLDGAFEEDDSPVPVGFTSDKGFQIPDFFRNFLSAPPVWIKDKL